MTLLFFAWFGVMAFLIGIMTDKRWPLAAWTLVALLAALDYTHQPLAPPTRIDVSDKVMERVATSTPGFTKVATQNGGY